MPDTSSGRRSYMEGPRAKVSFSDIIGRLANGRIAQGIKSGATLAGDVYQGRVDPTSAEGIARSGDMAGLAMMGSIGGAGGTVNSGIKAFHGSPHSFDKFDMSKIGTGEGAQAYGHGLYFAENEGVAKGYRDALAPGVPTIDGVPADVNNPMHVAATYFDSHGSPDAALKAIDDDIAWINANPQHATPQQAEIAQQARGLLESGQTFPQVGKNQGSMYEVNIDADPAHFLDYDAPLPMDHPLRKEFADMGSAAMGADDAYARNAGRDMGLAARNENMTGSGAYNQFVKGMDVSRDALKGKYGDEALFASPSELARRELLERGVKGIKYKDAGSRMGDGTGTSNYVVFDDRLVSIMKKYGLVGAAGAATAAQIAQELDGKLQANLDAGGA